VLKLNAAWFAERQFATMTGLLMFIGNMGGFLSAAPLAWLVGVTSWRNVFVGAGALSLLLGALIWALLRDNPASWDCPRSRRWRADREHQPQTSHWREGLALVLRNPMTWPGFFMNLGLIGSYLTFNGLWARALPARGAWDGANHGHLSHQRHDFRLCDRIVPGRHAVRPDRAPPAAAAVSGRHLRRVLDPVDRRLVDAACSELFAVAR